MKKQISEKVIKSTCGVPGNCIYDCNVLVHVKEGKVIKVEGDPETPYNRGPLCIKGLHGADGIYSPSRLKHPLKRIGEGGQGKWRQVCWDEALEIIPKELNRIKEKYGPLSIAGWSGDPPSIHSYSLFLSLFIRSLGSPNLITHTDLCAGQTSVADYTTFGEGLTRYVMGPDIPNTRCILIVGSNLKASAPPQWTHLLEIKSKGAKIIVVDPRLTETAQKADIWLQIKPGTDAALALGMLNIIINRGLYDKEFVEKWTNGSMLIRTDIMRPLVESDILEGGNPWKFTVWDMNNNEPMAMERSTRPALSGTHKITLVQKKVVKCKTAWDLLVERVQEYAPKKVAEITELPQEKIVEGAIIFGKTNPACLIQRQGINHYRNSAQTARAFNILLAVTGNIDVPGGNLFDKVPKGFITNSKIWKDKKFRLTQEIEKKKGFGNKRISFMGN
jgi:anaerobic selenocysteine-containing dehydrogenase